MKKICKFLIAAIWITLLYILFRFNILTGDMNKLDEFFQNCGNYKILIFIAVSSLRVVALIPSAVFMVLGGMMFNPVEGFILTLISIALSEGVIYLVSKVLVGSEMQNCLVRKYPRLYELLLENNTKILALGILCPVAPSDVVCFLASSTGIGYRKFILTTMAANMPMMILYSFLGGSVMSSASSTIIIVTTILLISGYTIRLWSKAQKHHKLA